VTTAQVPQVTASAYLPSLLVRASTQELASVQASTSVPGAVVAWVVRYSDSADRADQRQA
jgi:hypothetical protein